MNAGEARGGGLFEFDERYFADPEAAHERLRAAGPIHRAALPSGDPAWLIVGYEQVRAALTDPRLTVDKRHAGPGYTGLSLPGALDRNLLSLDADDHGRLRRLAVPAFTAEAVAPLEPRILATATGLFEALAAAGGGDLTAGSRRRSPGTRCVGCSGCRTGRARSSRRTSRRSSRRRPGPRSSVRPAARCCGSSVNWSRPSGVNAVRTSSRRWWTPGTARTG